MLKQVDKHSGIPAYIQIINMIKSEILLGNLNPGAQLPTVRKLKEIFQVNINTVLKALEKLKIEGIVSSEQGIGYFVNKNLKIDPKITNEIREIVKNLKKLNIDLQTLFIILEEVWKNEKI
ncbi:transcriptional regulator [Thermosipho melanesiensis]|uniref:Regulatory protein GntR, HTH n=2 Tax=Thermosipho melanesiensis TaxID=46541 RepID=A6LMQ4_THEM4|nr:GntR family transcriptional regulator [Thermosipho melanesiensis]ABR31205.1 regulatory protein GntR, HTH [Thermosipho melanesiensis BI429]APT74290.1 transcriptional regulator [Thermosipho melanesiensis]OOC36229.1 transcriptional regulator [Thermosipho melanesiensis]OOC37047.1 transcriptional regulator [Thermosipho melanesiensis]OOC37799.1 transcriptional regulator [Thermosipho melanesiensis]